MVLRYLLWHLNDWFITVAWEIVRGWNNTKRCDFAAKEFEPKENGLEVKISMRTCDIFLLREFFPNGKWNEYVPICLFRSYIEKYYLESTLMSSANACRKTSLSLLHRFVHHLLLAMRLTNRADNIRKQHSSMQLMLQIDVKANIVKQEGTYKHACSEWFGWMNKHLWYLLKFTAGKKMTRKISFLPQI